MKKEKSFTLIELILVISVILILAAIAVPAFYKTKQKAIQKEGLINTKLIAAAEIIQRAESVDYVACTCSNAITCAAADGCNTLFKLMLNTTNWTYSVVTAGSAGSKTATITSTSITGCTYTFQSADFKTDTIGSSGCI